MSDSLPYAAMRRLLPFIGAIAALLAIASASWALDRPWLNFAFKPLATLSVIAWAALGRSDDGLVKRWIVIGLVFSLAGDVALLWPVQGFLVGLVAFLLGHASYMVALTRRVKFLASPPAFGVWAIVASCVLAGLWAGVPGELRAPVLVYV
nr:lysoplasmalogenase [Pseudomonadota bacterium]